MGLRAVQQRPQGFDFVPNRLHVLGAAANLRQIGFQRGNQFFGLLQVDVRAFVSCSACGCAKRRNCLDADRLGPMKDSKSNRASEVFTMHRAIDPRTRRRYATG